MKPRGNHAPDERESVVIIDTTRRDSSISRTADIDRRLTGSIASTSPTAPASPLRTSSRWKSRSRSASTGRVSPWSCAAPATTKSGGADRDQLDPILDACVEVYKERLDEDGQVDFKGKAKAFERAYGFLASILPYTHAEWEKLSIFLNFLVPKLPAPVEEDLSKGILESIDMDSYRVEKKAVIHVQLADEDAEIEPVPTNGGGHRPEPELDRLSNILKSFNDQFGNIPWTDGDRIHRLITEEIPNRVAADRAYQNAKQNSDKQNARIEHDKALRRVMTALLQDDTELFKQFSDNESFRRWLTDTIFSITYEAA